MTSGNNYPADNFETLKTLAIDTWAQASQQTAVDATITLLKVLLKVETDARKEMLELFRKQTTSR